MGKQEQQGEKNEMRGGVKAKIFPLCSICECITLECDRDERAGEAGAIPEGPGKCATEFRFDPEEQWAMDPRFRSGFSSSKRPPHFRVMWGDWRQSPVGSRNSSPWTTIHGNLSERRGRATRGWRGKGLNIWMDRASDAGLQAWGERGVGRKQQSTDHFPVAILVNQLSFSCFRLVRVTISVTKEPHPCILFSWTQWYQICLFLLF